VEAIEFLDWDLGVYKSLVVLGLLLALMPLMRLARRRPPVAGGGLLAAHRVLRDARHPCRASGRSG
jgi:hypothetical protein